LKEAQLHQLKKWFREYSQSFMMDDPDDQRNLDLKIRHTQRVCDVILDIGQSLNLDEGELRLAAATALLHDIGRFEQYQKYRTFMDSKSEDHATLGTQVLEKHNVLEFLIPDEIRIIRCAVLYHNRLTIPTDEDETCLFFSQLLRDADKIDVYKVVTDYYQIAHEELNETIQLDLPDLPGISDSVYNDLQNKQVVSKDHLHNLNDFKLLQMGWIYDMHFKRTFEIVRERHYLDLILESMPDDPAIIQIGLQLKSDLEHFCMDSIDSAYSKA